MNFSWALAFVLATAIFLMAYTDFLPWKIETRSRIEALERELKEAHDKTHTVNWKASRMSTTLDEPPRRID
jgi:Flp pilus assembly protein TadB